MLRMITHIFSILFWVSVIYSIPFLSRLYNKAFDDETTIRILTWADVFDKHTIEEFTKKTGIKVRLSYYESNEEMLVKLQATGGKGYDLIIPSDYAVTVLKNKELLQKIDHSKVPVLSTFSPKVIHQPFDPENLYSLPCLWEIFVLGIDNEIVAGKPSWKLLFQPPLHTRVAMANDPREAMIFAHQYLYGNPAPITSEQITALEALLRAQRKQVEAYVEYRADYLLATHNCAIAVSSSSYILRSMKQFPHIQCIVPREGTFITVENFVIPKASEKTDLAYAFINYMYTPEVMMHLYDTFAFFPATAEVLSRITDGPARQLLTDAQSVPLNFIQLLTTEAQLQKFWVAVKG